MFSFLRKIKRRRDSHQNTTEHAPLLFHKTRGRNVRMSPDMRQATRVKDYHKAVCFSNRPVAVNECVHIHINDTTDTWTGAMRIGFTHFNPAEMNKRQVPSDMSPGLTTRLGYWVIELTQTFAKKGNVLTFYVTPAGDVTYATRGVAKSVNFSAFDPNQPFWAVIDIYGQTTSVKIVAAMASPDTAAASASETAAVRGTVAPLSRPTDTECVVCRDRTADCVLVPCAHTCLCYTCAVTIRSSDYASCPICRNVIVGVNQIHQTRQQ